MTNYRKIKIAGTQFDKRCKLTQEQREEAKRLYHEEGYDYKALGNLYNVTWQAIQAIIKPPKRKKYKQKRTNEYCRQIAQRVTERKKQLVQDGLIKIDSSDETKKN